MDQHPANAKKPAYWKETIHNQHRRAVWHNYYDRAVYMVTIGKHKGCPDFGSLKYTDPKDAFISLSPYGTIVQNQIDTTPLHNPQLKILEQVIMPDHVHILIQVMEPISKHFGDIIQAIKSASTSGIRKLIGNRDMTVFEEGFHDRIVKNRAQLDTLYRYLRENPRRLAVRRAFPEYFRRVNRVRLAGGVYCAYGNFQLLDCPFKEQVVVHRADSEEVRATKREQWLYTASNNGVLVSPFISPAEKAIRVEADEAGGRFILITDRQMGERYKPSGRDFELCEAGRMLIVSAPSEGENLSRAHCLRMNRLASAICN